jgi:signal transduction histidine kinase
MWIETESGVGRVDLDPDRIEQAVVHLAINASEAMSGAGKLRITVRRADLSEAERRRLQATAGESDFHNGPFALLAVQDTGCGMSEEVASRLFEPFFTTKAHRENAGLGLATVYNIIRAHNGYIEVKTQPGRGTTFLIYMPVKEEPQAA